MSVSLSKDGCIAQATGFFAEVDQAVGQAFTQAKNACKEAIAEVRLEMSDIAKNEPWAATALLVMAYVATVLAFAAFPLSVSIVVGVPLAAFTYLTAEAILDNFAVFADGILASLDSCCAGVEQLCELVIAPIGSCLDGVANCLDEDVI